MSVLPIELIALVAQYADMRTQGRLSAVSRDVYSICIRTLYQSIPEMSVSRTTQCLLTLSKKPELAHLVRCFTFLLTPSPLFFQTFLTIFSRALSNMNNLHSLMLDVDVLITMDPSKHISCQLTYFYCCIPTQGSFPVSQFLASQPTIQELHIICHLDDISSLGPEALPALRKLTAPLSLLPRLLPSRFSRLSQLFVLGDMIDSDGFMQLGTMLTLPNPPRSLELAIHMEINTAMIAPPVIASMLSHLGQAGPFISTLVLNKQGGRIEQDELQSIFISALPRFPNLKILVLMSQDPPPDASLPDPQTPPVQALSLNSEPAPALMPNARLDAFHDRSCYPKIVKAWRQIHSGLKWVVFPAGTYRLQ
ncbi:hypothetical protein ACGC1H_001203 [Rhizoctonia solani]|uniref:F-box domain-containing protein n=1 Tax=Rhizoctonia solani TaxID=456999 RepID=A0A8H3AIG8_9AGAM|nr:unnamed protein product [Rhizoctonia solani]